MNECANETTPHNDAVFTSGNAEVQGNKDVSFFFFFFFSLEMPPGRQGDSRWKPAWILTQQ